MLDCALFLFMSHLCILEQQFITNQTPPNQLALVLVLRAFSHHEGVVTVSNKAVIPKAKLSQQ